MTTRDAAWELWWACRWFMHELGKALRVPQLVEWLNRQISRGR